MEAIGAGAVDAGLEIGSSIEAIGTDAVDAGLEIVSWVVAEGSGADACADVWACADAKGDGTRGSSIVALKSGTFRSGGGVRARMPTRFGTEVGISIG